MLSFVVLSSGTQTNGMEAQKASPRSVSVVSSSIGPLSAVLEIVKRSTG